VDRVVWWHGQSESQLRALHREHHEEGYRTFALSVYGAGPAELRFAAAMRMPARSMPEEQLVLGATAEELDAVIAENAVHRMFPVSVSATGPSADPRYAAVLQRRAGNGAMLRADLPAPGDAMPGLVDERDLGPLLFADGWLLLGIDAFGTADTHYVATLLEVPGREGATTHSWRAVRGVAEDRVSAWAAAQDQQWNRTTDAIVEPSGARTLVFRTGVQGARAPESCPVEELDYVLSRGLSEEGLYLVSLRVGTDHAAGRDVATLVWAQRLGPEPRVERTAGKTWPAAAALDDTMLATLRYGGARAASLAVAHRGELVHARAYTIAEDAYPELSEQTPFRFASCSKVIIAMAVVALAGQGKLSLEDTVGQHLGDLWDPPAGWGAKAIDPALAKTTLRALMTHSSGVVNDLNGYDVAAWYGQPLPITPERHVAAVLLTTLGPPVYSNAAYALLGAVVGRIGGGSIQAYEQVVKDLLCAPLGLAGPRVGTTLAENQPPDEAPYHSANLQAGASVVEPVGAIVAGPYGLGDMSRAPASGGWALSSVDFAKLLSGHLYDRSGGGSKWAAGFTPLFGPAVGVWGAPEARPGYTRYVKGGGMGGTASVVWVTDSDVVVAAVWNQDSNIAPGTTTTQGLLDPIVDPATKPAQPLDPVLETIGKAAQGLLDPILDPLARGR
jgi:CubicO group peptidase (beta-lactamase class C family)